MSKTERESELLQRRRMRAARMLRDGVAQAEVARRVSVTRTTVSEWNAQLQEGGLGALKSRRRGRPAGLQEAQRRELMRALKSGALAEGFATDLWTLPRVGELIKRRFARSYSESQVWRILVALGFSCQRPSGRALERNESAIQRWKQRRWPVLKKTLRNKAESSSSSTSRD
jgi:transposase